MISEELKRLFNALVDAVATATLQDAWRAAKGWNADVLVSVYQHVGDFGDLTRDGYVHQIRDLAQEEGHGLGWDQPLKDFL